jgi:hypothetical protein
MKDEPRSPSKHLLDHAIPTVIHNEEENLPVLARWLKRGMDKGAGFWIPLAGVCLVVIALGVLASGLSMGRSTSDDAWNRLALAKDSAERVKVAEDFPDTPAARWALLQAATETYNKGFRDLPANREAAEPLLRKARTQFEQVVERSPKDSPQARIAALGVARALEAHNDLEKAIKQYEHVAKTWPESPEAKHAERLARALRKPENVAFYKELYAYKPVEATIPPMGTQGFTLPDPGTGGFTLPPNHPPVDGPTIPAGSFLPPPPPPSPGTSGTMPARDSLLDTPLPGNVFSPEAPTPKVEPTEPAPKAEQTPATGSPAGTPLPGDVFTPEPPAPKAEPKVEVTPKPEPATPTDAPLPGDVFAPETPSAEAKAEGMP